MSIYTDRWNAVHELFTSKIISAFAQSNVDVTFDGQKINRDQVVIGEQRIDVIVGNCTYCIYDGDLELDAGAYDTIDKTIKRIKRDFGMQIRLDF